MDRIIEFFACLSLTELFTLLIALFTGLTVVYYRKTFISQKPMLTKIQYMYKDDVHIFFTIVNTASHLISLKNIYIVRFLFKLIPIKIQKANYDDPTDKERDLIIKSFIYDRPRTFVRDEDTIHCLLNHPLKLKSLHLIFVKTTHGVALKFFHPGNYLINNA